MDVEQRVSWQQSRNTQQQIYKKNVKETIEMSHMAAFNIL